MWLVLAALTDRDRQKAENLPIQWAESEFFSDFMIGMNYRILGHVFDQKRIRGAAWRLVRRGVQDALYGLSDDLKATVMGKVGTLRRVSWKWVLGS